MIGEVDIYGVLFPPLLIWLGVAMLISLALRWGLNWIGLYRYVWHRSLFDFCLLIILTGLVSLLMNRVF
jgi:hypothetical protein